MLSPNAIRAMSIPPAQTHKETVENETEKPASEITQKEILQALKDIVILQERQIRILNMATHRSTQLNNRR